MREAVLSLMLVGLLAPTAGLGDASTPDGGLGAAARQLVASVPGEAALAVRCGSRSIRVNAERRLRAASTLKVAVALAAMRSSGISPAAVEKDPVYVDAIVNSGNDAANQLIARAGGLGAAEAFMSRIGMRQTSLDRHYGEALNTMAKATTASDLLLLADALRSLAVRAEGPLADAGLAAGHGAALLRLMQRATHTSVFVSPKVFRIAHKSGWLDTVENDMAVMTLGSGDTCTATLLTDGVGVASAQKLGRRSVEQVLVPLSATGEPVASAQGQAGSPTGSGLFTAWASRAILALRSLW